MVFRYRPAEIIAPHYILFGADANEARSFQIVLGEAVWQATVLDRRCPPTAVVEPDVLGRREQRRRLSLSFPIRRSASCGGGDSFDMVRYSSPEGYVTVYFSMPQQLPGFRVLVDKDVIEGHYRPALVTAENSYSGNCDLSFWYAILHLLEGCGLGFG